MTPDIETLRAALERAIRDAVRRGLAAARTGHIRPMEDNAITAEIMKVPALLAAWKEREKLQAVARIAKATCEKAASGEVFNVGALRDAVAALHPTQEPPGDALKLAGEALQSRIRLAWMSPAEYEQLARAAIVAFLRAEAERYEKAPQWAKRMEAIWAYLGDTADALERTAALRADKKD